MPSDAGAAGPLGCCWNKGKGSFLKAIFWRSAPHCALCTVSHKANFLLNVASENAKGLNTSNLPRAHHQIFRVREKKKNNSVVRVSNSQCQTVLSYVTGRWYGWFALATTKQGWMYAGIKLCPPLSRLNLALLNPMVTSAQLLSLE